MTFHETKLPGDFEVCLEARVQDPVAEHGGRAFVQERFLGDDAGVGKPVSVSENRKLLGNLSQSAGCSSKH
jgi:hypothetical protein